MTRRPHKAPDQDDLPDDTLVNLVHGIKRNSLFGEQSVSTNFFDRYNSSIYASVPNPKMHTHHSMFYPTHTVLHL